MQRTVLPVGRLKLQGWKMQEWKMWEHIARVANARVSPMNGQPENRLRQREFGTNFLIYFT